MFIINIICQSVRLLIFYFRGSTLVRFLAEIKQTPMTSLFFVNRNNVKSTRLGMMIEKEMSLELSKSFNSKSCSLFLNCYFCEVWIEWIPKLPIIKYSDKSNPSGHRD